MKWINVTPEMLDGAIDSQKPIRGLPGTRPVAVRQHPDGRTDDIVGFNELFADEAAARRWAEMDGNYALAADGTPYTKRRRIA